MSYLLRFSLLSEKNYPNWKRHVLCDWKDDNEMYKKNLKKTPQHIYLIILSPIKFILQQISIISKFQPQSPIHYSYCKPTLYWIQDNQIVDLNYLHYERAVFLSVFVDRYGVPFCSTTTKLSVSELSFILCSLIIIIERGRIVNSMLTAYVFSKHG